MSLDEAVAWETDQVRSPGGFTSCSSVLRFGVVLKSSKELSADQAYDIGQVFFSRSEEFSKNYERQLGQAFNCTNLKSSAESSEPRYRMAPAIIVDYPELEFQVQDHHGDRHGVTTRVCFTVGSGRDCKIWIRFNLEKGIQQREAASIIRRNSAIFESILQDFLIESYRKFAERVVKHIELDSYIFMRIYMFGFIDQKLMNYLKSENDNWGVFGNFGPAENIDKQYIDYFHRLERKIQPERKARGINYVLYRAPISRRGQFRNNSKLTACSLVRFDLSPTDANIYGICYEHAGFLGATTDSSAHVASGELSFELGRLY